MQRAVVVAENDRSRATEDDRLSARRPLTKHALGLEPEVVLVVLGRQGEARPDPREHDEDYFRLETERVLRERAASAVGMARSRNGTSSAAARSGPSRA